MIQFRKVVYLFSFPFQQQHLIFFIIAVLLFHFHIMMFLSWWRYIALFTLSRYWFFNCSWYFVNYLLCYTWIFTNSENSIIFPLISVLGYSFGWILARTLLPSYILCPVLSLWPIFALFRSLESILHRFYINFPRSFFWIISCSNLITFAIRSFHIGFVPINRSQIYVILAEILPSVFGQCHFSSIFDLFVSWHFVCPLSNIPVKSLCQKLVEKHWIFNLKVFLASYLLWWRFLIHLIIKHIIYGLFLIWNLLFLSLSLKIKYFQIIYRIIFLLVCESSFLKGFLNDFTSIILNNFGGFMILLFIFTK